MGKPIGSRMRKAGEGGLHSFEAFRNFGVAAVLDFLNGDISKNDAATALELLEAGAFKPMRLQIEAQMAAGYRVPSALLDAHEPTDQPETVAEKLAGQIDGVINGTSKINVPAAKLLLLNEQMAEQQLDLTVTAAILKDPEVVALISKKLAETQQKGEHETKTA